MLQCLVISFTLLAVLLSILYIYLTSAFDYWKKRGVPGPKPLPLFGTFPCTITRKKNIICDLDDIYRKFKNKAKFVGVFMTRNPQIMIIDPELAKQVLINNFKCFMDNESSKWADQSLEPLSSGNPFGLTGNVWKIKRAEIVPGLTASKTKVMYPVIDQGAKKLVKFLRDNSNDALAGIETKELALKCTGEVVADVVWGIEADAFQKRDCKFVKMAKLMIRHSFQTFMNFFIIGIFPFIRPLYSFRIFTHVTDEFFTKLTEMSVELRKKTDQRQDFLEHLIQVKEKNNLPTKDIVAHSLTFLFDGFESSAVLISHCLLLLARNPEIQDKLRTELIANSNREVSISFNDLMRLPYLDQVINETLRIFTPLAFMSKICTEPCELTNSDGSKLQLQKEDIVIISIHSYHHDEEYYPDPEQFNPERFNEENGGMSKYKNLGVFFPFGDGPRKCIGMTFALAQAKAAVAEVIRNFELTIDGQRTIADNTVEPKGFISNLKGGIHIRYKDLL